MPTVCHPYPLRRIGVLTQGKSRMRESRLSGSVEGVMRDQDSYSDCEKIAAAHCTAKAAELNRFYGEWEMVAAARYFLEHDAATAKTVRKIRIGSMG